MTPPLAIDARGLGKRYRLAGRRSGPRHIWAISDLDFEVPSGSVVGLIGRNGAGKSTLLRVLSRITEPTAGEARIRGRVGTLLEVGTGFHPELTGRENVYLNGAILGMKRAEIRSRFDAIVEFAGVEAFIDTPVKRYSSGMYVRLGFAVAAHFEPEVLLVDEVLAVGDLDFQQRCVRRMGQLATEGRTVLLVSHNLRTVERLTEHCLYLEGGKLAASGPTREVIGRYQRDSLGPGLAELPAELQIDVERPAVLLDDVCLARADASELAASFRPGEPATLTFACRTSENLAEPVVCVRIYREGVVVAGNNSEHGLGRLSLEPGATHRFRVDFDGLWLTPGAHTLAVFVLPSYVAALEDSLSRYSALPFVVEGSRKHGGGHVYLAQRWSVERC